MNYAYVRTSTKQQNYCPQIDEIFRKFKDIDRIFIDRCSGFKKDRKSLNNMFSILKNGDKVISVSLDRIGRSFIIVNYVIQQINNLGAYLITINENINTKTNPEEGFIKKISDYSEIEIQKIKERTASGRFFARKNGTKFGRKPRIVDEDNVVCLHKNGFSYKNIADKIGVSRSTVYRFLKKRGLINNNKILKN